MTSVFDIPGGPRGFQTRGASPGPEALITELPLGRRTPLVLLSGMLGDETLWDEVAAGLAEVALPWPARIDRDDSVPELAAGVLAEAPPRFALAGHSLGAIVALEIARRAPCRLTALALINASARGPSEPQQETWARWRRRTEAREFAQVADELAAATLGAPNRVPALVHRNRRMADSVGAAGFVRQLDAQATRPDSRDAVPGVDVPLVVVSSEFDDICPPELQEELAGLFPAAELVTIPGAGHMTPLENPSALAAHLRRWLERSVRPVLEQ